MVLRLCGMLIDAGMLITPADCLYYFEKPWHYAPEYDAWKNLGFPDSADGLAEWIAECEHAEVQIAMRAAMDPRPCDAPPSL